MFNFGPYQLDPATIRFFKHGQEIILEPQVFNTLLLLIENRERVVTKEELFTKIWHGRSVSDHVITRIVYELRKLLDENSEQNSYIRTVRGKGYQFDAAIKKQIAGKDTDFDKSTHPVSSRLLKPLLWLLFVIALIFLSYTLIKQRKTGGQSTEVLRSDAEKNTYPIIAVLPIAVDEANDELSMLVQSLIEYLTHQLSVNLNMKVIHPDSLVTMSAQLDDIWAIQKVTRSDFIIEGFIESMTDEKIFLHLNLYKKDNKGALTPFDLGAFKFPYPKDVKELNSLYKERKVTIRNIIQIIKPGVVIKDNGESESDDPEAYRLVIAAHHISKNDDCNDLRRAETLLLKAVERDQEFAYAYYQLFANYFKRVWLCGDSINYHQKALAMAEIVERLAPNTYSPMYKGRNAILIESNQVEQAYQLSKDADWNDPDALNHKVYGLRFAGFLNLASQLIDRILQLDPFYYSEKPINQAPNTLMYLNRYTEYMALLAEPGSTYHDYYRSLGLLLSGNGIDARHILQGVIDRKSTDLFGKLSQALFFIIEGNNSDALMVVNDIVKLRIDKLHTDGEMTYKLVQLFALADAPELALKYLQVSVDQGFFPMNYFLNDPALKSIRETAEFKSIVNQATQRHEAFAKKFDLKAETKMDLSTQ